MVGFVNGCLTVFFDVAYQSYLPSLVERDQLVEGNSKLEITRSAAQILGPGLAGVLIGLLRAPFAMVIDSVSYFISAFFVFLIRRPEPPVEPHDAATDGPKPSHAQGDRRSGFATSPAIAGCARSPPRTGASNFFGNVMGAILILYVSREGLAAQGIGFAFSIGSVGVLVAALITSRLTARIGVGRMLVLTSIGFSLSGLPVAIASSAYLFPALALFGFMGGFFGVAWNINQISLRQAITPPRMQGRMNATMRFIVWGTIPLGAIIGGILGDLIGLHATIWVGAIGGLLAFLPVALSSVRQIVTMPEPAEDDAPGAAEPAGASPA